MSQPLVKYKFKVLEIVSKLSNNHKDPFNVSEQHFQILICKSTLWLNFKFYMICVLLEKVSFCGLEFDMFSFKNKS